MTGARRGLMALAALLVALMAAPFALNLAGDAQVHLAIAEAFAAGRPFQYNPGGEIVVASTSPFWTMLLALYFTVAGRFAPLLLSLTVVAVWLSTGYVLYRAARDLWGFTGGWLAAVVLLWLAHTTVVANALGGLENVLSALQLLLIYYLTAKDLTQSREGRKGREPKAGRPATDDGPLTPSHSPLATSHSPLATRHWPLTPVLGLLLGWAILTRPDGGLLALLLVGLYLLALLVPSADEPMAARARRAIVSGAIIGLVALAVLVPWYAYQYAQTGRLVTDSSIARLYNGRQGSLAVIPGLLYVHPKAFLSLASAFLPLSLGFLVAAGLLLREFLRARGRRAAFYAACYAQLAAVLLVIAGFAFFTFVVGAEAFGRYFLPVFPFLFLAGVDGWRSLVGGRQATSDRPRTRTTPSVVRGLGPVVLLLAAAFLVATSALDAYRRLGPGRFTPERALDVIYGPANRQYYAANLPFLLAAPPDRAALTDGFLADLGALDLAAEAGRKLSIAVTEVQLRYFLDERVDVYSLDGRTSADILRYTDPLTGVPDFERYFLDTRPDYVHAAQWCEVGGWLAGVLPLAIEDNLVCAWERQADAMQPGESFTWDGRRVTLVAPHILRIDWQ